MQVNSANYVNVSVFSGRHSGSNSPRLNHRGTTPALILVLPTKQAKHVLWRSAMTSFSLTRLPKWASWGVLSQELGRTYGELGLCLTPVSQRITDQHSFWQAFFNINSHTHTHTQTPTIYHLDTYHSSPTWIPYYSQKPNWGKQFTWPISWRTWSFIGVSYSRHCWRVKQENLVVRDFQTHNQVPFPRPPLRDAHHWHPCRCAFSEVHVAWCHQQQETLWTRPSKDTAFAHRRP